MGLFSKVRTAAPVAVVLCIGPMAVGLTNTARVSINPSFSGGGGPIDIIQTNPGTVDATGSTTGGFNSSGDATTHTQYGLIRVTAHALGGLGATGTGIFQDSITITSPGVTSGTPGTLVYDVRVTGGIDAWSGSSAGRWQLRADLGGGPFDISADAEFSSPELPNHGYHGSPFGTYSATVSFQFGMATTLDVQFSGTAGAANGVNGAGAAAVDPFVLAVWGGIHDVKANGTPVGSFGTSSGSGTNWAPAANACPADLNGDNQVDDADFVLFAGAYNILDCADPAMPAGCPADLNGDGVVDDADFVAFVAAYNELVCP